MFPTNRRLPAALLVALAAFMAVAIASYGGARPERSGGGEEGGATLAVDETFDTVRKGARLILSYDRSLQAFIGTVVNTTNRTLRQVRVEVHLSNGVELGPTTPQDLAGGKAMSVRLDAEGQSFTGWTPHAEVGPQTGHGSGGEGGEASGGGEGSEGSGGEGGGEHGAGGEGAGGEGSEGSGGEGGEGAGGAGEEGGSALTLDQTFDTVRKGARLVMSYDRAAQAFIGTVENTTSATLQQVRVEVHLSNGVELGPTTPQDLAAGNTMPVRLDAAGQSFTGWTPHAEVGPQTGPHGGESSAGGEGGEGSGGEGAGEGSEGSEGGEGSEASEGSGGEGAGEEGGSALTLDETFDTVRKGARLIMGYDRAAQAFIGTVENTTGATLQQVRVEIHLSNGVELGPTTPKDLAAGEAMPVRLDAAGQSFTGWTPHAEVGPQTGTHGSGG